MRIKDTTPTPKDTKYTALGDMFIPRFDWVDADGTPKKPDWSEVRRLGKRQEPRPSSRLAAVTRKREREEIAQGFFPEPKAKNQVIEQTAR